MARKHEPPERPARGDDVVFVGGATPDGSTLAVLRKRGDELSAGLLRRAEEGKPVHGELLRLAPREDAPRVCDVEVLHAQHASAARDTSGGPAQVSSPAYRAGWNAVFGTRAGRALPN